ncbi:MAG: MarR family transcriptional regulator [Parvibaculum sp.]|jgi:DNA-binding MarR family transcriptional regulator
MMPTNPDRSIGFLVGDCSRILRRGFNERVTALGLTQAQWRALVYLSRNQGLNQVRLAELLEVQPITVARLIDKLVAIGLVERRPDPQDRRAQRLFLSSTSAPLLDRLWATANALHEFAYAGMTDEEQTQLIELLLKLRSNLIKSPAYGTASRAVADRTKR